MFNGGNSLTLIGISVKGSSFETFGDFVATVGEPIVAGVGSTLGSTAGPGCDCDGDAGAGAGTGADSDVGAA